MGFKNKMKKAEQEDALLEANNSAEPESQNEDSGQCSIMMDSVNMNMIADFLEKIDNLTDPNFKIQAEYKLSEELKEYMTEFVRSVEGVKEDMRAYYNSIPDAVFDKIRKQILEDVKKSQAHQRYELWLWRIAGGYGLIGLVSFAIWFMIQNSLLGNNPMVIFACVALVSGFVILAYKIGGWLKN